MPHNQIIPQMMIIYLYHYQNMYYKSTREQSISCYQNNGILIKISLLLVLYVKGTG